MKSNAWRHQPSVCVLEPRVHDRDARGARRMRLHRRRRRERDDREAELASSPLSRSRCGDAADDERAAVELLAVGVERLLGRPGSRRP